MGCLKVKLISQSNDISFQAILNEKYLYCQVRQFLFIYFSLYVSNDLQCRKQYRVIIKRSSANMYRIRSAYLSNIILRTLKAICGWTHLITPLHKFIIILKIDFSLCITLFPTSFRNPFLSRQFLPVGVPPCNLFHLFMRATFQFQYWVMMLIVIFGESDVVMKHSLSKERIIRLIISGHYWLNLKSNALYIFKNLF